MKYNLKQIKRPDSFNIEEPISKDFATYEEFKQARREYKKALNQYLAGCLIIEARKTTIKHYKTRSLNNSKKINKRTGWRKVVYGIVTREINTINYMNRDGKLRVAGEVVTIVQHPHKNLSNSEREYNLLTGFDQEKKQNYIRKLNKKTNDRK